MSQTNDAQLDAAAKAAAEQLLSSPHAKGLATPTAGIIAQHFAPLLAEKGAEIERLRQKPSGTTCWACEQCGQPRTGRGCQHCEIERLKAVIAANQQSYTESTGKLIQERDAAVKKLPSWIPVSERLPADRSSVLVAFGLDVMEGIYASGQWGSVEGMLISPSHWMPMPALPQPKGQEHQP